MSYFLDKKFTKKLDEGRRIIPLIDHDNIDEVIEYIELLTSHKFSIFEYTLRHQHSIDHIKILRKKFPQIILGAGSVKDKKTISMLDKKKINFFGESWNNSKFKPFQKKLPTRRVHTN